MSGKLSAIFTSDPGQKKVPDFSPWDFAVCQISKNKEDVWAWLKHAQRWFWSFFLTTFIRVDIIVIKVTCSVSFYKMQCFYAAALTDIKWMCSVSIFRSSMSKWNLYYQNNVNHLKPTEPYKLLPYYTTAACSNAEQECASARGLFLRWNCQKQKSPKQNKTIQNQKLYLAFLHSITLTEMISACKMYFLILFALKGHLPLNV